MKKTFQLFFVLFSAASFSYAANVVNTKTQYPIQEVSQVKLDESSLMEESIIFSEDFEDQNLLPCCMISSTTVIDYSSGTSYTFYGSYCDQSGNCDLAYIAASNIAAGARDEFMKGIEK